MEDVAVREAHRSERCRTPTIPDPVVIERHVGTRIRERRIMLGISQHELARGLGVSFQQAHRYEKGQTRLSAGTLHRLAELFHVEIGYFFHGLEDQPTGRDRAWQRLFIELARAFEHLQHDDQRRVILELSRVLAQISPEPELPIGLGRRGRAAGTAIGPRLSSRKLEHLFEPRKSRGAQS